MDIYIVIGIIASIIILALILILIYNKLVSVSIQCEEAWSNVDTELKRRYDLIPTLVSTVKGYAVHERSLLKEIVQLREAAMNNRGSVGSQAASESALQRSLESLLVRIEAYPELKANQNFLELQKELVNTEDRIQAALRFYNGNVRENNNNVRQFPSNIIAGLFNFGKREFFKLEDMRFKQSPTVEF